MQRQRRAVRWQAVLPLPLGCLEHVKRLHAARCYRLCGCMLAELPLRVSRLEVTMACFEGAVDPAALPT